MRNPDCRLFKIKVYYDIKQLLGLLMGACGVRPASARRSLSGGLLQLGLSVGESDTELLGAGDNRLSTRRKKRD